ncbi:MAG TPA: NADH-quinone oxidoreductase subunit N [Trueperaceae bacterium]|nr:NADH-quinone oxidoreductase subunit N [Trueperaceae bacterium]
MTFPPSIDIELGQLAPSITLLVTVFATLLFALWQKDSRQTAAIALVGVVTAFGFNLASFLERAEAASSFGMRFLADTPALALTFLILVGTALAILVSYDQLRRQELDHPEYYPLMLLSALGALVMAAAGDLVTLVLGLEIMSLAIYVLSAWRTRSRPSEEAGMKYFLLGSFGSAILIYGAALLYGASGSFVYGDIVTSLTANLDGGGLLLASLGAVLVLAGLAFKAALVPFHQWAPDVYTGAPTPVTTFMSVVIKVAAFAGILRLVAEVFPHLQPWLLTAFAVTVAATLVVGNLAALQQRRVKRMLAYSAVAHAGYVGLAVLAAGEQGMQAAIWYLSAYALMNIGAFAVLSLVVDARDDGDSLEHFAGLGAKRPGLALAMTFFLLSLGGIPPLAGFAGKIMVFEAAISAGYLWLAVLGILTSVVALLYYFRVIGVMYFQKSEHAPQAFTSGATTLAIAIALAGTVALGVLPGWWHDLVATAARLP